MKVLRLDTSARKDNSVSRALSSRFLAGLRADVEIIHRDLSDPVPLIGANWVAAAFMPDTERTEALRGSLAVSDALIEELQAADLLVIGLPVYNFTIPASLKLWLDQVCRANVTFRHTPDGPVGLLEGKRAVLIYASGGTRFDSEEDFASDYMRHVLGFIGIDDVRFITDENQISDEAVLASAEADAGRPGRNLAAGSSAALAS